MKGEGRVEGGVMGGLRVKSRSPLVFFLSAPRYETVSILRSRRFPL